MFLNEHGMDVTELGEGSAEVRLVESAFHCSPEVYRKHSQVQRRRKQQSAIY